VENGRIIGALAGSLLLESWPGKRVVELEAKTRVSSEDIAATLTDILGKPVKGGAGSTSSMGRGLSRSRYDESHAENSDDRGLQ
jgi:uncharacterized protein YbjT (DUF2867 family)